MPFPFHRRAAALFAAATTACSVLVGGDDLSSNHLGTQPLTDAPPGAQTKGDAGSKRDGEAGAAACDDATKCEPQRIFPGASAVADYPITVVDQRVYFGFQVPGSAHAYRIASTRTDGTDLREHYNGDFLPIRLQVNTSSLYATVQRPTDNRASVRRIPRTTSCVFGQDCEVDGADAALAGAVTVTGNEMVWSERNNVRVLVGATKKPPLPVVTAATLTEMRTDPTDGTVFVLANGLDKTGAIFRYQPGTTALTTFAPVESPRDLFVTATEVFVLLADGTLRAYPKAGGAPRSVATGLSGARHMVSDGANIYLTRVAPTGAGSIEAVAADGASEPRTLASPATEPESIALDAADATYIYWTDAVGSVWKLGR